MLHVSVVSPENGIIVEIQVYFAEFTCFIIIPLFIHLLF